MGQANTCRDSGFGFGMRKREKTVEIVRHIWYVIEIGFQQRNYAKPKRNISLGEESCAGE